MICKMSIKNIKEYNPDRKCEVLIVFDDMIVGIISNKNLNQIVTIYQREKTKHFYSQYQKILE